MPQERLGEACGYSRVHIGAIERCEANITIEVLEALAEALGAEPNDLLLLSA
jgi:transcriptional regulator with XRE-family HTH domain